MCCVESSVLKNKLTERFDNRTQLALRHLQLLLQRIERHSLRQAVNIGKDVK